MKPQHLLLAVAIAAIWGFNFVVIKLGVAAVPPYLLTGLRFLFSAIPAIFFLPRPKESWKFLFAFGLLLGVGQFSFLFLSFRFGMTASLASLVMQVQAFFTMFMAWLWLSEVPRTQQIWGAVVAFLGLGVIASERWTGAALLPLFLCMIAAAGWAAANVTAKQAHPANSLAFVVWSSLVVPIPLFAMSWMVEDHAAIRDTLLHPSWTAIISTIYLAFASTVFGYGAWNYLMKHYPASTVAPFSLLVPMFGIVSGVLVLGESFGVYEVVGSIIIIFGLLIGNFGARFFQLKKAEPEGSAN